MVSAPQRPAALARPPAPARGRAVLRGAEPVSDALFEQLCMETDLLEFERSAEGDLIISFPAGFLSPDVETHLLLQLLGWMRAIGGRLRGASAGYRLTETLLLSPDISWLSAEQDQALGPLSERPAFWPVCPFLVIEVRSKSQSYEGQYGKMLDWMEHGCQVGLLVDWIDQRVALFRAGQGTLELERPSSLELDPERLPDLVIEFDAIWDLARDGSERK